jgi:DNA polymerase theta
MLVHRGKKALIILPFVSLVEEVAARLSRLLSPIGIAPPARPGKRRRSPLPHPVRVEACHGSCRTTGLDNCHVAVCTMEKAHAILNRLVAEDRLGEVGFVAVDEVHMLGDPSRGHLLELLISKLRFAGSRESHQDGATDQPSAAGGGGGSSSGGGAGGASRVLPPRQLVLMSATLPNGAEIARWLGAALYTAEHRPVPLDLFVKLNSQLHSFDEGTRKRRLSGGASGGMSGETSGRAGGSVAGGVSGRAGGRGSSGARGGVSGGVGGMASGGAGGGASSGAGGGAAGTRELHPLTHDDATHLALLCAEVTHGIRASGSGQFQPSSDVGPPGDVLVFCPTKNGAEAAAVRVARAYGEAGLSAPAEVREQREALFAELEKGTPTTVGDRGWLEALRATLPWGVAFHHAGLSTQARELIEAGFRRPSTVCVLCCTSTLAAGINLPCRRVLITSCQWFAGSPVAARTFITSTAFRQMAGRAGRMGLCARGDAILFVSSQAERTQAEAMLCSAPSPVQSCIGPAAPEVLRRFALESVACGQACDSDRLSRALRCTLAYTQLSSPGAADTLVTALRTELLELVRLRMLEHHAQTRGWAPTVLGRAVFLSGLHPDEAIKMNDALRNTLQCFQCDDDLQLILLLTPPRHVGDAFSSEERWQRCVPGHCGEDERHVCTKGKGVQCPLPPPNHQDAWRNEIADTVAHMLQRARRQHYPGWTYLPDPGSPVAARAIRLSHLPFPPSACTPLSTV